MNSQRLLNTFLELVAIDSPSRHEAKVAAWCAEALENLGFTVSFDDSQAETGSDTGNLIAELPGTSTGHLILSAHMDCVEPCIGIKPVVEGGIIRSSGDTVLGADDKAGIAAILEAVQSVVETKAPHPHITVLLTTCEEISLLGAAALAKERLVEGAPCFVFDASGKPGTVVVAAPFHYTFQARFKGKAAHAGVEPEAGISAIQMAARAIAMMPLGRVDEHTTANVGIIKGGYETNIIPDACNIVGECRSLHEDKVDACRSLVTQLCEQAAEDGGGSVDMAWSVDYPGVFHDTDDPLISTLSNAASAAGLNPQFVTSGGGADTNIFKAKGVQAITLGIGMTSVHSTEEHITITDLENITHFCKAIIDQYSS